MTWLVTSAPRGQSCTVSNCHVAKTMPYQQKSGAKDLFQIKNLLQGCNSNFFFTGKKIKRRQITGTKIIFKKKKILWVSIS